MRLSIEHTTGFHYDTTVRSSYNEARLTPLSSPLQSVWSSRVSIEPQPWSFGYRDYWGTQVTAFEIHDPHKELTVTGQSVVQTQPGQDWASERRVPDGDPGWEHLRGPAVTDAHAELLAIGPSTAPPPELAELAAGLAADTAPRLAALDICDAIAGRIVYRTGATQVRSTAAEVWQGGSGVCQDFSHLTVGALRSVGIPARYVSGYLHPGGAQARVGAEIEGESHSWVEFWCGEWVGYDPTGSRVPGEHYVRIGHGRDYRDVAPLRGTYAGGASQMFVTVRLTRLG